MRKHREIFLHSIQNVRTEYSSIRTVYPSKNHVTTYPETADTVLAQTLLSGFLSRLKNGLKEWKINIFKIMDTRISFYSRNTHLLPPKPKSSFRHLKRGIQDFHMNYVLVPADKAANNVVVV